MTKILKFDIKNGCFLQWKKYIAVVLLVIFSCISFYIRYSKFISVSEFTFGDYLFWNFRGMKLLQDTGVFVVPNGFWLALNLFLAIIVGSYPSNELYGSGQQYIIRLKKRISWWNSKCIWCVVSVCLYYLAVISTIFIMSAITGKTGALHTKVAEFFGGSGYETYSSFITDLMVVFVVSIALSYVQMAIALIFNPKLGYVFVAFILISGIYSAGEFSPGSGLMMIRLSNEDVNGNMCILISVFFIVVSYVMGSFGIKEKDIYKKHVE